ncbi:MAG: response regulator transcription factor [Desulfobulbaceae bacterium]|nr:response regulator transcription factor [Desulfobulbaceae bacterium]
MSIFLCSHSDAVRERWHSALAPARKEVYQATSVSELLALAMKFKVELLLLHRDIASIDTIFLLRRSMPECKIFVLSNRPDQEEGLEFLRYGIVGYANTYIAAGRLAEAVQAILTGSVWIGQDIMQLLIRQSFESAQEELDEKAGSTMKEVFKNLSNREYEIANLIAQGLTNVDIADRLAIAERTVKAHLSSIYAKTGTRGRLGLALLVNRGG